MNGSTMQWVGGFLEAGAPEKEAGEGTKATPEIKRWSADQKPPSPPEEVGGAGGGVSLLPLGREPCRRAAERCGPEVVAQHADLMGACRRCILACEQKNKGKSEGLCVSKERGSKQWCKEMLQPKMRPEFRGPMKLPPPPSAAAALSVAFSLTATLIPQPFEVIFIYL